MLISYKISDVTAYELIKVGVYKNWQCYGENISSFD